jgi:RND family efflux transporter MFP subunit
VGTPVSGIVSKVAVRWGDRVQPGDTLFAIDDRDLRAALVSAEAKVAEAAPVLEKARYQLGLSEKLGEYLSREEVADKRFEAAAAEAALESAKAKVREVKIELDRRLIRAPAAGRILAVNVRPGEFAANGAAEPLLILGNDDSLLVRVEVDEHDAWRVKPGAKAVASLRGEPSIRIPVSFQRIEPRIVPKSVMTGIGTERTDTRVLQVIFGFARNGWPVYVGQEMDVSIEAAPAGPEAGARAR